MTKHKSGELRCPATALIDKCNFRRNVAEAMLIVKSGYDTMVVPVSNVISLTIVWIAFTQELSHLVGKPTIWFPNRSDTNRPVQPQMTARSLKFRLKEEEGLYYSCCENKGADELRGYREADLRLCFRICRLLVFPCGGSIY